MLLFSAGTGLWDDVSAQATLARRLWHPASPLRHFLLHLLGNVPLLLRQQREEILQEDFRRQTGAVAAPGCTCAFLFYCFHQPFPHGTGFSLVYMNSINRSIPAIRVKKEYIVPWLSVLPTCASHRTYVALSPADRQRKKNLLCYCALGFFCAQFTKRSEKHCYFYFTIRAQTFGFWE